MLHREKGQSVPKAAATNDFLNIWIIFRLRNVSNIVTPVMIHVTLTSCHSCDDGSDSWWAVSSQPIDGHLRLVVDSLLQLELLWLQLVDVGLQSVHRLFKLPAGRRTTSHSCTHVLRSMTSYLRGCRSYFSFFFSRVWASSSRVWIFSTRSSASLEELSSFFSSRLRRTFASLSSSPWKHTNAGFMQQTFGHFSLLINLSVILLIDQIIVWSHWMSEHNC